MQLLKGVWNGDVMTVTTIYNMNNPDNAGISTEDGVLVEDDIVYPEYKAGIGYILKANRSGDIWFEEVEVPLTPEEEMLLRLQQQQSIIDMLVLEALTGGNE